MVSLSNKNENNIFIQRVEERFNQLYCDLVGKTDRVFGYLLLFQWVVGMIFAIFLSPKMWSGGDSQTHIHLYAAIFLGGLIAILPAYFIFQYPGLTSNRMMVSCSQMLFSVLLIHLSGGRIETHFHIFGSLAFLSFYRDWRPIVIATILTFIDHLVRGFFWPESVYGVITATPWRAFEHAGWVIFEDSILLYSIKMARKELWNSSESHVKLEQERESTKLLLELTIISNETRNLDDALRKTLKHICLYSGWKVGHAYIVEENQNVLLPTTIWYFSGNQNLNNIQDQSFIDGSSYFPTKVFKTLSPIWVEEMSPEYHAKEIDFGLKSAFYFPLVYEDKVFSVLEFFSDQVIYQDHFIYNVSIYVGKNLGQVKERDIFAKKSILLNQELERKVSERTQEIHKKNRELAENQQLLINTSKMSALGEMAGGVAHEINNPLAIIKGYSEQIQEMMNDDHLDRDVLRKIMSKVVMTTERISKIVKGLKSISRDGSKDIFQKIYVYQLLDETFGFCSERFKNQNIFFKIEDFDRNLNFEGRSTEVSQVILNLLNNASDAIMALADKWIKVSVKEDLNWIYLRIIDSGNGIPKVVREKLFQPFFTTKEIGKGTGIGLSISKGIIHEHHGELYIDELSPNTCFVIKIPKNNATSGLAVAS